jgi:molybdopterin-guanine dinucleotide biosynthesis protein A
MHPVAGIFPLALREDLRAALVTEKLHKVGVWVGRHNAATAEWPDTPVDPFFNVNTPEDRAAAEALARQYPDL